MAKMTHAPGDSATWRQQRLRDRFITGERDAFTDATLLELLLPYAIPQHDAQPLARPAAALRRSAGRARRR